jgi:hypothetical protein
MKETSEKNLLLRVSRSLLENENEFPLLSEGINVRLVDQFFPGKFACEISKNKMIENKSLNL